MTSVAVYLVTKYAVCLAILDALRRGMSSQDVGVDDDQRVKQVRVAVTRKIKDLGRAGKVCLKAQLM